MEHRRQIQDFLVSRRARISPESVGLPVAGRRRRVPGLRREEVAALAGLSVDYYVRLERGALTNASDGVLNALAGVLRLDPTERAHLVGLARAGRPAAVPPPHRPPSQQIAPQTQAVLDALVGVPAMVRGAGLDMVAVNPLGRALYGVIFTDTRRTPNVARFAFLDPRAQEFWGDWDRVTDDLAALLRTATGAHPHDRALTDLVGELTTGSERFRRLWARHDVRVRSRGSKRFRHPAVGELDLRFDLLHMAAEPGLDLIVYTAEPGTPSHDNLALLALLTRDDAPDEAAAGQHLPPPAHQG
ncbi:helix-turn-helix domain-containing protein [Streptomyces sp. NPDC002308]